MVRISKPLRSSNKKAISCLIAIFICSLILVLLKYEEKVTSEEIFFYPVSKDDFALAKTESLGFFDNVSSEHWSLLKNKVKDIWPNYNTKIPPDQGRRNRDSDFFYKHHYEADFVCQHERRIGKLADGGKWICDPHRIAKQESCLVYSIGSNNDFSFEEAVLRDIGSHCEIHTFDFDDYSEEAKKSGIHYHQIALGEKDGVSKSAPNVNGSLIKSLKTIVKDLGHEGRTIDIFKIDCERCEWFTFESWFDAGVILRQIQVEVHLVNEKTKEFFDTMYKNNYVVTHKEPNIMFCLKSGTSDAAYAIEYAFLKLTPEFFEGIRQE